MHRRIAPLFAKVNSATRCNANRITYISAMEKPNSTSRKAKIQPVHRQEAALLKALFKERAGKSQTSFGLDVGWSQGNVGHYLHARQPLNLAAAIIFSRELKVPIEAFSPRLANEMSQGVIAPAANDNVFDLVKEFPAELRASLEDHIRNLYKSLKGISPKE